MSLPEGSHVLTVKSGCDMDLLEWVTALKCDAMSITQWNEATLCQQDCATDYMQMVMYSTDVVLRIPVQCNCSQTKQLYCSKVSV